MLTVQKMEGVDILSLCQASEKASANKAKQAGSGRSREDDDDSAEDEVVFKAPGKKAAANDSPDQHPALVNYTLLRRVRIIQRLVGKITTEIIEMMRLHKDESSNLCYSLTAIVKGEIKGLDEILADKVSDDWKCQLKEDVDNYVDGILNMDFAEAEAARQALNSEEDRSYDSVGCVEWQQRSYQEQYVTTDCDEDSSLARASPDISTNHISSHHSAYLGNDGLIGNRSSKRIAASAHCDGDTDDSLGDDDDLYNDSNGHSVQNSQPSAYLENDSRTSDRPTEGSGATDDLVGSREDDIDPRRLLLLEEGGKISSLMKKVEAREETNPSVIAVETQFLQVIEWAVVEIFDPLNPQYDLLSRVVNDLLKVLSCNDKYINAVALYRSRDARIAEADTLGLDNRVTWGEILSRVRVISNEAGGAELPESIVSMVDDARAAVRACNDEMTLDKFVRLGMQTKLTLGNLIGLAIIHTVTSQRTIEQVCSETPMSLEWRANVEELHNIICPDTPFSADVKLSDFMTTVLRPGLSSRDREIFDLSCRVMVGIMKILNMTNFVSNEVRAEMQAEYQNALAMTMEGRRNDSIQSEADYCSGTTSQQTQARNAIVTDYMINFAHDALEPKLEGATTGERLIRKLLCTCQAKIRQTFKYSFFEKMTTAEPYEKMNDIRAIVTANQNYNGSRSLLIDSKEQVTAMQNIFNIALNQQH